MSLTRPPHGATAAALMIALVSSAARPAVAAGPAAVDVRLAEGQFRGRLLTAEGRPRAGTVRVRGADGVVRRQAVAEDGRFGFDGLASGGYLVAADGGRPARVRLWSDAAPKASVEEFALADAAPTRGNGRLGRGPAFAVGGAAVAAAVIGGIAWAADDDDSDPAAPPAPGGGAAPSPALTGVLTDPADLPTLKSPVTP